MIYLNLWKTFISEERGHEADKCGRLEIKKVGHKLTMVDHMFKPSYFILYDQLHEKKVGRS